MEDFKIGADPEFCLLSRDGESLEDMDHALRDNSLGYDGDGTTLELRPRPSFNPLEVVKNIRGILVKKIKTHPDSLNYQWHCGSYHSGAGSFGGHIHFGTGGRVAPDIAVTALAQYVGACGILIENTKDARLRRDSGYGAPTDMRIQRHGFEYRAPSSWITSPYVAAAMLCLGKIVVHELLESRKLNTTRIPENALSTIDKPVIQFHFPTLWNEITHMELYQTYKPHVDLIYFLVKNKRNWYPTSSFQQVWGLADQTQVTVGKVQLNAIWNRYSNSL